MMARRGTIAPLAHHGRMISRAFGWAAVSAMLIHLTGCDRPPDKAGPRPGASAEPRGPVREPTTTATSSGPSQVESPSPGATPAALGRPALDPPALDRGALTERRDPARVLRYYATAIERRDWPAAARAWGQGSGVTAATLKAAYDRPQPPRLDFGTGRQEGAAGSLYYEAPATLRFGETGTAQRGTLVLRRVNDVDGASAEQLRWHIEHSTIGAGQ